MGNKLGGQIQEKLRPAFDAGPLAGTPIKGLLTEGNIDVNHRPSILNADGTHSSIFSMTEPINADGSIWNGPYEKAPRYALVPSIANGKFLTPDGKKPNENDKAAMERLEDAARSYYSKTRQQLGIFSSGDAADRYAGATHTYMNDGTTRRIFAPSPPVVGANGPNGYPPPPPSAPIPIGLQGKPSPNQSSIIGELLKSLLN